MPILRHSRHIARLALVWFVLSIGASIASPLIQAQDFTLICSGNNPTSLIVDKGVGQDTTPLPNHALNCPMCMPLDALPAAVQQQVHGLVASVTAPRRRATIRAYSPQAGPLPARGPPQYLS